jgi:hypothetical protein
MKAGIDPASIGHPVIETEMPPREPRKRPPAPQIKSRLPEPLNSLILWLSFAFLELACCFKNPNFSTEEEWRLVHKRYSHPKSELSDEVELRTSGATLVPFVKLPIALKDYHFGGPPHWYFSLDRIVYGPGLNAQVSVRSLQYLTSRFPHVVDIEPSQIKAKV